MSKVYYAHSVDGRPPDEWQPCLCGGRQALDEHLVNVAELAQDICQRVRGW